MVYLGYESKGQRGGNAETWTCKFLGTETESRDETLGMLTCNKEAKISELLEEEFWTRTQSREVMRGTLSESVCYAAH